MADEIVITHTDASGKETVIEDAQGRRDLIPPGKGKLRATQSGQRVPWLNVRTLIQRAPEGGDIDMEFKAGTEYQIEAGPKQGRSHFQNNYCGIQVGADGIVVGWKGDGKPENDYSWFDKARITNSLTTNGDGRLMKGIGVDWDVAQLHKDVQDQIDQGIVYLMTVNPPGGWENDWKTGGVVKTASVIDRACPLDVIVHHGNEWGHVSDKGPYWPMQATRIATWIDGMQFCAPVVDQLLLVSGRSVNKIAAASMNNPSLAEVKAMCAEIERLDPNRKRWGIVTANFYSAGGNWIASFGLEAVLKYLRDFCNRTGRKLYIPEWGCLNVVNDALVEHFRELLKVIRKYAHAHYVWVGFAPVGWKSVKLMDDTGKLTAFGKVWREVTGLGAGLP